jgi:sugar lactone lactonase YvrE
MGGLVDNPGQGGEEMKRYRLKEAARACLLLWTFALLFSGCRPIRPFGPAKDRPLPKTVSAEAQTGSSLIEVAASERLWTGIAVSRNGRIFVCFPRWSGDVQMSVGEVLESGRVRPFPDTAWNHWGTSASPDKHFICVQSVHVDKEDNLWVLDPASPYLKGVVPGGAKLVKVNLKDGRILKKITFDETVAPSGSYLNDVRVDTERDVAYITDSGLGAIVVVDLETGIARRVLADHASVKSEDLVLAIGGKEWRPGGVAPKVHADGLALSRDGEFLYYHALTGRTLYRIETRWLRDAAFGEHTHGTKVESLYETCATDGMAIGPDGYLYLTAIEDDAIKLFVSLGKVETVVKDPKLKWPDSIAFGPDGSMYVTTSQIHLGDERCDPYRIFKITLR